MISVDTIGENRLVVETLRPECFYTPGNSYSLMGFSTSGVVVLLFIVGLLAASVLVPTLFSLTSATGEAFNSQSEQIREQTNTGITITEATSNPVSVEFVAENTGTEPLEVNQKSILIDGEYVDREEIDETSVDGNTETNLWLPGSTAEFEVETDGENRVKLITTNGVADAQSIGGS